MLGDKGFNATVYAIEMSRAIEHSKKNPGELNISTLRVVDEGDMVDVEIRVFRRDPDLERKLNARRNLLNVLKSGNAENYTRHEQGLIQDLQSVLRRNLEKGAETK